MTKNLIWIYISLGLLLGSSCSESVHKEAPHGESVEQNLTKTTFNPRLGDRFFVKSVFLSVFRSVNDNQASDPAVKTAIDSQIMTSAQLFGGTCKFHDPNSCISDVIAGKPANQVSKEPDIQAVIFSGSSPPREGRRINTCRLLTEIDGAITVALGRAGLVAASEGSERNLTLVYKRFYPGRTPDSAYLTKLKAIFDQGKTQYGDLDAWRLSIYAVCVSAGWQVP